MNPISSAPRPWQSVEPLTTARDRVTRGAAVAAAVLADDQHLLIDFKVAMDGVREIQRHFKTFTGSLDAPLRFANRSRLFSLLRRVGSRQP